jgi:hypothetical protein
VTDTAVGLVAVDSTVNDPVTFPLATVQVYPGVMMLLPVLVREHVVSDGENPEPVTVIV